MKAALSQEHLDRASLAQCFLSILFPKGKAQGFIELRAKCPRSFITQRWHRPDSLPPLASVLQANDDCDVWVGASLRREPGSGGAKNCAEAWSFFVDADLKTVERAQTFKDQLTAFPLAPTIVVATGSPHSYHAYWRLVAPVCFADVSSKDTYTRVMRGLAGHFDTDRTVCDPPRVMRLVGSRNQKPGAGKALVQMLKPLRADAAYALEAFLPYADVTSGPTLTPAPRTTHSDDVDLLAEFAARGWVIEDQGDAFYYVACPWKGEHSGFSGASETALWQYGSLWCFKCQHSHCAKRRVAEVYEYFRLMQAAEVLR